MLEQDWNQYLEDETEVKPNHTKTEDPTKKNASDVITLEEPELADFIKRISGNTKDQLKAHYQAYDLNAPDKDLSKSTIYPITHAKVSIHRNYLVPDFFVVDFAFPSAMDQELKLFWARYQQHLKNETNQADQQWVFYLHIMENAAAPVTADIFNPVIGYLTREIPDQIVPEERNGTELVGGNIIRLLVYSPLLQFRIEEDVTKDGMGRTRATQ